MKRRSLTAAILAASFLLISPSSAPASPKPIETFTAFAASLGTGKTGVILIDIYRWSTDAERESLLTTLQEFGPDGLLKALEKIRPPVGRMRTAGSLGWDLYYARNHPAPDGSRRVVFATNRNVSFREVANNTRSMQYQFTLIEIHLDATGTGDGKLVPAAKVSWDRASKKIEIDNYNALPVDLMKVTVKKP
ncbi:MAG TPA: hypothetical protein VN971_10800 [Thermoanaerobaculia bacterium]|nr:hypothetical protein [Thermoanaerobaculia bacterium]